MDNYTELMRAEVERVTLKGNADKITISRLASIIWQMDQRISELEAAMAGEEPAKPVVEEKPKVEEVKQEPTRRVSSAAKK